MPENFQTKTEKSGGFRDVLVSGTRVGGYEIVSVLGRGAFGITYRARDGKLHRDLAIKEFLPAAVALREHGTMVVPRSTDVIQEFVHGRERFLDEARILAKLDRAPAVIRVYDFLEENGTAYMVMAVVEGETLDKRIKRERHLGPEAVNKMLYPMLDGLEAVHSTGFLHRDIKPSNIVLDGAGNPTLIDFGAARAALAGHSMEMTAIFTPGYAAAEQFTSTKQGPWTDIYGLSATLYHAIAGHPPPSAFDRVFVDAFIPLVEIEPPGFASGLLNGLDAGLAVRASDRPQSIREWRSLLQRTSMGVGSTTTIRLPRPSVSPARSGAQLARRLRIAVATILVVALAALGLFVTGNMPLVSERASSRDQGPGMARPPGNALATKDGSNCLDNPNRPCVDALLGTAGSATAVISPACSNFSSVRSGRDNWKDIWTTSIYSYAPGGGTPGGGRADGELKVGGWGDWYYSLLSVDISRMPKDTKSAALILYSLDTGGTPVAMYVDRVAATWNTAGDRLWWRDLPQAIPWAQAQAPRRNTWYVLDITGLFHDWRANRVVNYGIQLRPFANNNNNNLFVSSRGEDQTKRPGLLACN